MSALLSQAFFQTFLSFFQVFQEFFYLTSCSVFFTQNIVCVIRTQHDILLNHVRNRLNFPNVLMCLPDL